MKKILTLLTLAMFTFTFLPFDDAEAKRVGGGKSIGKQRDSINQQATPKPAQSQSAAPASAAAAGGASKWGGALAGLAAGGLLAALFMGGAFENINMADILVLLVLAAVIFFIIRMVRKSKANQAPRPMQFSGAGADRAGGMFTPTPSTSAPPPAMGQAGAATTSDTGVTNSVPADFEVEPFLRNAKLSFIHLQEAYGAHNLNELREYATPEMFAELEAQIKESGDKPNKTEVLFVNANLLDVTVTNDMAIASVRFNGQLRESPDALPEAFDEIWHVQKDLKGQHSAWLLTGIQQPS
ncbi:MULTISPECIES: Tim44 domain-containing protein [Nitrosomonas]|uniref:Preprotein translocase subunit Tim44 n=1 Tax=Nitrosomonas communis TaxID=44574 RepID=A0A0F7KG40_9PROT|nr:MULTISPECIES: TIM44-like domain-containing protein [Nitrosomonas]AKH39425.1 preprotein translocase subunit Tim44 [Nitrosomonas communis]TYP93231.1 putative lipid-binding transport protein (Tim44 family) [Nitrosomonas communis]UVS62150.1 TIM44-like domain-containing protein [Nitrosomonas sp. PLL12]